MAASDGSLRVAAMKAVKAQLGGGFAQLKGPEKAKLIQKKFEQLKTQTA